jgi:exonuclease III
MHLNKNINNITYNIFHWNCFSFKNKIQNFLFFLETFSPDIVMLNETKLSETEMRKLLDNRNYKLLTKERANTKGGGVAMVIKNNIKTEQISLGDQLENTEYIALELEWKNNTKLCLVAYYNPPDVVLRRDLFDLVHSRYENYVVCGDLNSKTLSTYCSSTNSNGEVLEEILTDLPCQVANDNSHTFFNYNQKTSDVLDLFIVSSLLFCQTRNFATHKDWSMESDHVPISLELNSNAPSFNLNFRLNFRKANWFEFSKQLNINMDDNLFTKENFDHLYSNIVEHIQHAACNSIPLSKPSGRKSFPKHIIELIEERRNARSIAKSNPSKENKSYYNGLTKKLKAEIENFNNKKWLQVANTQKNDLCKQLWKRINNMRGSQRKTHQIKLQIDESEIVGEADVGEVFKNKLETVYVENENNKYNNKFKSQIETELEEIRKNSVVFKEPIDLEELNDAIDQVNTKSAPGDDNIHNIYFRKMPVKFKSHIVRLFNLSLEHSIIPNDWKKSLITMIGKKAQDPSNPDNYRPISLTSCFSKLLERIVSNRIYKFVESNNLLHETQSGFRKNRSTIDNLTLLTQKIVETLNRKKKLCAIFFDISKAFDKLWRAGIFYKMYKMNIPSTLVKWVEAFLANRSFNVKVGETRSSSGKVETGVPQGSVLGPLLFLIFINDIPKAQSLNRAYTSLFADDLTTMFIYDKPGKINKIISRYLADLENWLNKWRLDMSASKCCYTIFANKVSKPNVAPVLYDTQIPYNKNPVLLGVTFDEQLSFNKQIENIKTKAIKRMNLIKILASKHFKLKEKTLLSIYKSLIRSIIEYNFFFTNTISLTNLNSLQVIQNKVIKIIFKPKMYTNLEKLHVQIKLDPIAARLSLLLDRYIHRSINNTNTLITSLINEYKRGFDNNRPVHKFSPLENMLNKEETSLCTNTNATLI